MEFAAGSATMKELLFSEMTAWLCLLIGIGAGQGLSEGTQP